MFESFIKKIALQVVEAMRRELLVYLAKAFREEFRVSLNTFDNRVNTMYDNLEAIRRDVDVMEASILELINRSESVFIRAKQRSTG